MGWEAWDDWKGSDKESAYCTNMEIQVQTDWVRGTDYWISITQSWNYLLGRGMVGEGEGVRLEGGSIARTWT